MDEPTQELASTVFVYVVYRRSPCVYREDDGYYRDENSACVSFRVLILFYSGDTLLIFALQIADCEFWIWFSVWRTDSETDCCCDDEWVESGSSCESNFFWCHFFFPLGPADNMPLRIRPVRKRYVWELEIVWRSYTCKYMWRSLSVCKSKLMIAIWNCSISALGCFVCTRRYITVASYQYS